MCAPFHPESGRYARIRGAQTFSPHLFSLFSGNVPAGISATAECVRPNRSSIDSNPEHILAGKSCVCTQRVRAHDASNRAWTWVCTRSRVHVSAKSRRRIDLDSSRINCRVCPRAYALPLPHLWIPEPLEGIGKREGTVCVCETGYLVHVREKFCHQTLFAFIVGVSSHRIISSDDVIVASDHYPSHRFKFWVRNMLRILLLPFGSLSIVALSRRISSIFGDEIYRGVFKDIRRLN